jgi:hypothetical protein
MSAPKGNDFAKKLKTKEVKEKVYKDYCNHIATGAAHKSWKYEKNDLILTWETIEKYISEDKDFDPLHKQLAIAKSLAVWEKRGIDMMLGRIEKCQPAIYQMFMRNKFGWDKQNKEQQTENTSKEFDAEYPNEK